MASVSLARCHGLALWAQKPVGVWQRPRTAARATRCGWGAHRHECLLPWGQWMKNVSRRKGRSSLPPSEKESEGPERAIAGKELPRSCRVSVLSPRGLTELAWIGDHHAQSYQTPTIPKNPKKDTSPGSTTLSTANQVPPGSSYHAINKSYYLLIAIITVAVSTW